MPTTRPELPRRLRDNDRQLETRKLLGMGMGGYTYLAAAGLGGIAARKARPVPLGGSKGFVPWSHTGRPVHRMRATILF